MISSVTLRSALASPNPFDAMDHIVRKEMKGGRKVSEILAAMQPHVDSVLELPGLTAESEEAFLGTLDALMGNCRPEQCYRDAEPTIQSSNPKVPATLR
jgi:hypothetical protein